MRQFCCIYQKFLLHKKQTYILSLFKVYDNLSCFNENGKKMQFSPFFSVIHAKLQQSQTVAAVLPSCQVGLKLILTIFLFVKSPLQATEKASQLSKKQAFSQENFLGTWYYSILSFNYQHCPSVMCRTPFY